MSTVQDIIENGMAMHAKIDNNVRARILNNLSSYLDKLYAIYDLDRSIKFVSITISANVETVAMPTDMYKFDSIAYDSPYQGTIIREVNASKYNYLQSIFTNNAGAPPIYVWNDWFSRVMRLQPISTVDITAKLVYFPEFATIALGDELQTVFPITRLLELFCYLEYTKYDRVQPEAGWHAEFKELEAQFIYKYRALPNPPVKDSGVYSGDYY